jgi:pyrroloquinoline quinone (PQQ) biosynthesis protein C
MAASESAADYLREPSAEWVRRLRDELILPRRAERLRNPLLVRAQQGAATREELAGFLLVLLSIVVRFPEYIAALGARCPAFDWEIKTRLLSNAYEECRHPFLLARTIRALGGDPEPVLRGESPLFDADPVRRARRAFVEQVLFERPWIEGVALLEVGIETIAPYWVAAMGDALRARYGLSDDDLEWFAIHGGAVEQEHGNDGLLILERYVAADDLETQARCRAVVERISGNT